MPEVCTDSARSSTGPVPRPAHSVLARFARVNGPGRVVDALVADACEQLVPHEVGQVIGAFPLRFNLAKNCLYLPSCAVSFSFGDLGPAAVLGEFELIPQLGCITLTWATELGHDLLTWITDLVH